MFQIVSNGVIQLMGHLELVPSAVVQDELGLSRSTLWRLRQQGLPSLKIGGSVRYHLDEVRHWLEQPTNTEGSDLAERVQVLHRRLGEGREHYELMPCHWSTAVALDPKHRPQVPSSPSSTVRKDWRKYPQEAHLLDQKGHRYRRLAEDEIAVIQGFPQNWAKGIGLTHRERIAGLGNAIPPALGRALYASMRQVLGQRSPLTAAEICAGFGGLALGGHQADIRAIALVEIWEAAVRVLRNARQWDPSVVHLSDVKEFDWAPLRGQVDILSGGPPCQPWSQAGLAKGATDERDLLGFMPDLVGLLQPKAFIFENVPGLISPTHQPYLVELVARLRNGGEYGVAVGTVQAADYGVPQRRKRVIIAGIRNRSVGVVHDFFDQLFSQRTHSDPRKAIPSGCRPWVTLEQALPDWTNGSGWRRWIDASESREEYALEA